MIWISSLALGMASTASILLTLRALRLDGRANVRFTIWFVALVALALALPASFFRSAWVPPAPIIAVESTALHAGAAYASAPKVPLAAQAPPPADLALSQPARPSLAIHDVFAAIWITGVLFSLGRAALGLLRLRLLLQSARVLQIRASRRGPVRVVAADLFNVPVAVGYRRPAVVLPSSVLSLEHETDLEHIVMHELEHLRRYDDVTSLVQVLLVSVLWFNPFAYIIANRLAVEREMACDEAVVACTGSRGRYAETLWKMAACTVGETLPQFVSAFRSRSTTVPRLDNLLNRRPVTTKLRALGAILAVLLFQAPSIALAIASPFFAARQSLAAFASVRLRDGDTLVVGGKNADGSASRTAQLYDARGRRIALIPTNVARWAPTLTVLRCGDVLVTGGVTEGGVTADAEIYQTETRRFHAVASMLVGRAGHTATLLLDGRVLLASGELALGRYTDETEIYDPRTNRFTRTVDGDSRVGQSAMLVDNGSVLITGGRSESGPMTCTIIYDPAHGIYRSAGTVVARNGNIIVTRLHNGRIAKHVIISA